ncbi:hypothetical protein FIBSPDRAFT_728633 [Athelia psychrophila]|uniref:Uncharacterized protein n=1 Tax=Athelia psychrophila TaxID=1759441 RepID=A0A166RRN4_9AGAM|nr:hypothetical protein FIBSPDRAFT_728633 [Fibularhizoctonia sp. CBS 109695]
MPSSPAPPPPLTNPEGRPKRKHRLPPRYVQDLTPEPPAPIPPPAIGVTRRVILIVRDTITTGANKFGLWREYPHRPSLDPDQFVPATDLRPGQTSTSTAVSKPRARYWPFRNMSIYLLMDWMHSGSSMKSVGEVDKLSNEVLSHPDFKLEDIAGFSARTQNKVFDASDKPDAESSGDQDPHDAMPGDGWIESTVDIMIPLGEKHHSEKERCEKERRLTVHGLHHRPLLSVMKAAVADASSRWFHYFPFRRFWKSPSGEHVRCYDEAYTSDVWLKAHDELQKQPNEPDCKLEKVILGLMFWSDSTHLSSFGDAKVWPIYMYFGNLSKYMRSKPSCGAAHHVAYIPPLPDDVGDKIPAGTHKRDIMTHCKRELFHAVWDKLLDDDFVHSYKHGFTGLCSDGVWRRFYPRIFSYSADYPEKILIAGIRSLGQYPCPRCFVTKSDCDKIGLAKDTTQRRDNPREYTPWLRSCLITARDLIYKVGKSIIILVRLLFALADSPSDARLQNIFAEKLGINPYAMLVVDMLHEFELGVWKYVFVHLIRLLHAALPPGHLVDELDKRYRQVPTFGRSTIRRFSISASAMKKLAARNYEDLLQCAIPVFEGLLPDHHNAIILTLLYRLAEWHALGKLRLHTETTRSHLAKTTVEVGKELRRFRDDTCENIKTTALLKEEAARARQKARRDAKKATASKDGVADAGAKSDSAPPAKARRAKKLKKLFDLNNSKTHNLPDYAPMIKDFGTTDSFSSQVGELEHRRSKGFFPRTSKKKYHLQMTKLERRQTRLWRARRAFEASQHGRHSHHPPFSDNDKTPTAPDGERYFMGSSEKHHQDLFSFDRGGDPASKNHILARRHGGEYDGDEEVFSNEDHNYLRICENRVYSVQTMRVNYTTYDVRREQDTINPRTHCNVMVASPDTSTNAHRFWYARVLGIFYVWVCDDRPNSPNRAAQRIDFLWIRWFGMVDGHRYGLRVARLPKVGFIKEEDASPTFGFLDPSLVVRACHLIPAFYSGRTTDLLNATTTAARAFGEVDDWEAFYVNIFADRDMFMREVGQGVGHFAFHQHGDTASTEYSATDEEMGDVRGESSGGDDEDADSAEDTNGEEDADEDAEGDESDEDDDSEEDSSDEEFGEDFDIDQVAEDDELF